LSSADLFAARDIICRFIFVSEPFARRRAFSVAGSTFVGYWSAAVQNKGANVIEERFEERLRPSVEKVRRLRLRAGVLSFVAAVASAMLPVTGAIAFEEGLVTEAVVSTAGVGAVAAGAFAFARRGRKDAARLEQEIITRLGEPPAAT
jgi:hypothetical protein